MDLEIITTKVIVFDMFDDEIDNNEFRLHF